MSAPNHTTAHTLDSFIEWVSAKHSATCNAMGATPDGDAYRAHLASFASTNTALQLLSEFEASHPTSDNHSEPVTLAKRRQMVCLQATWELDVIARALPGLVPNVDEETYAAQLLVRAMAGRVLRLTSALMGALSDGLDNVQELECIVMLDGGGQG